MISACVFYQVTDLGLRPALDEDERLALHQSRQRADRAEEQRLIGAQAELEERHRAAEEKGEELAKLLRAQSDPVYLERERRLLLAPVD